MVNDLSDAYQQEHVIQLTCEEIRVTFNIKKEDVCKLCKKLRNCCGESLVCKKDPDDSRGNLSDQRQTNDQTKKQGTHAESSSINDVDVVFVAMILKKNIGNDPVNLFQKAHSYWIGSKAKWENKCRDVNLETFDKIEDINKDGFMLVVYETKCPKDHIPQGVLGIQNALRNKNIPPHYTLLPPETDTFLNDFKQ